MSGENPDPNQQTGQEFDADAAMAAQRVVDGKNYGENAAAWIKGQEKGPNGVIKPIESKYNNMEIAAEAEGPEAESNRREMSEWSEKTGAYAEKAAREQKLSTDEAVITGEPRESVKRAMERSAEKSSKYGQEITSETGRSSVVRATETGIEERGSGHIRGTKVDNFGTPGGFYREKPDPSAKQLRSPAKINDSSVDTMGPSHSPFRDILEVPKTKPVPEYENPDQLPEFTQGPPGSEYHYPEEPQNPGAA